MSSAPKYPVLHLSTRSIGWVEWSDERQMWSIRFDDKIIAELPDLRNLNLAGVALSSGNGYQGQSK